MAALSWSAPTWPALFLLLSHFFNLTQSQQSYLDNKQLACQSNSTTTLGYLCNGLSNSCKTYLTFRSTPTYDIPVTIAYLLGADASEIARINRISDVSIIPPDTLIIVPTDCSCFGPYYQHNSSYVLKEQGESYYTVANITYQGLTTCQAMMDQNGINYLQLKKNMKLNVPLRCACPTSNQTSLGYKFLVVYLVDWGDSYELIASLFNVDVESIYLANQLSPNDLIYPFTPLLVPVKSELMAINTSFISLSPPPPSSPELSLLPPPSDQDGGSSHKWVFAGVGIGVGFLVICLVLVLLVWFFCYKSRSQTLPTETKNGGSDKFDRPSVEVYKSLPESESRSWSEGIKYASETLTLYKYDELQNATGCFAEDNRIKGSVFRGDFNGDFAAIKMMKGNVIGEINVLKQIHHSNIIRLSGFCLHEGNTYLVYEYAEKGCLSDWLYDQLQHEKKDSSMIKLNWKQRIQVAYDVVDALNYLHNYANPPYIHKNLKSSNILLDGDMRGKLANFSLARSLGEDNRGEEERSLELQMTMHVIGTQGYMAPEYIENGVVTPKLDVFAFGVVILELLSGREATSRRCGGKGKSEEKDLLYTTINQVLDGDNVRQKLKDFMDPSLEQEYPLQLAFSVAQLAKSCVAYDPNTRPTVAEVFIALSQILSTSLDWDPSEEFEHSRSIGEGR